MTYSDLMAGLLMIFALVLSVLMVVSSHERVESAQEREELERRREVAERRLGVRMRIVSALRDSLSDYEVTVDAGTGNVGIGSAVLFDEGDDQVLDEGRVLLDSVISVYASVFFDDVEFEEALGRIIVEGHTNDNGPKGLMENYLYNLDLSQRRAYNVMKYVLRSQGTGEHGSKLRHYLVASGRSFADLLYVDENQVKVDKERSRRIEIKFSLSDENMNRELAELFGAPL